VKKDGAEELEFPLTMEFFRSGVARVSIDEKRRAENAIELPAGKEGNVRRERYRGVAEAVLIGGRDLDGAVNKVVSDGVVTRVRYGKKVDQEVLIYHNPFKIEFLRGGEVEIVLNERNFMNLEHWRAKRIKKEEQPAKEDTVGDEEITVVEGGMEDDEDGMWEETFNGKTDSKPRGIPPALSPFKTRRSRVNWDGRNLR
jgi:mannosyl-oligosaccharide alpha-1,3-glucosidase